MSHEQISREQLHVFARKSLSEPMVDINAGIPTAVRDVVRSYDLSCEDLEVAQWVLSQKKKESDPQYGDVYNRMVCTTLDSLLIERLVRKGKRADHISFEDLQNEGRVLKAELDIPNVMRWSAEQVLESQVAHVTDTQRKIYAQDRQAEMHVQTVDEVVKILRALEHREHREISPQEREKFTAFWLFLKETQPFPLSDKNTSKEVLSQLARSYFLNEDLTLITLVCVSYIHPKVSSPGAVKISPGPIVRKTGRAAHDIDALEKFAYTTELFRSFLGDRVRAIAMLSDIDFLEVFKATAPEALESLDSYRKEYAIFCEELGLTPASFIQELSQRPDIQAQFYACASDVRLDIDKANRSDMSSSDEPYVPFSRVKEMAESIHAYYNGLPGVQMSIEAAIQNTIDKLAVYGSQAEALQNMHTSGILFVSSETPAQDWMYGIRNKKENLRPLTRLYSLSLPKETTLSTQEDI